MRIAMRHGRCLLILDGVKKVSVSGVGLMGCFFRVPFFVILRGFTMMLRGNLQMPRGLHVIVCEFLHVDVLIGHGPRQVQEIGRSRSPTERTGNNSKVTSVELDAREFTLAGEAGKARSWARGRHGEGNQTRAMSDTSPL